MKTIYCNSIFFDQKDDRNWDIYFLSNTQKFGTCDTANKTFQIDALEKVSFGFRSTGSLKSDFEDIEKQLQFAVKTLDGFASKLGQKTSRTINFGANGTHIEANNGDIIIS